MKNFFKYAMMLVAVVMSAVVISSCSKDDDSDNGGSDVSNNSFVVDGKTYEINRVAVNTSKNICAIGYFYNTTRGSSDDGTKYIQFSIKSEDESAFPTSLQEVQCEIELWENIDSSNGGKVQYEIHTPVKIGWNGELLEVKFSNLIFEGRSTEKGKTHVVSLSYKGSQKY